MYESTTTVIRDIGKKLIQNYMNGNQISGGINGPYDDPETPVRNLSHLAIICGIEVLKYGREEYIPALKKIGTEILNRKGRDNLWIMREKATKDQCNGVIGHAWLNEAFIYLFRTLQDEVYIDEALTVARQHGFNQKIGLWKRPTDGTVDYTMNHQLWYAATLAELNDIVKDIELSRQLDRFMERLPHNLEVSKNGRIRHSVIMHESAKDTLKQKIKNFLSDFHEKQNKPSMAYKEEGYHVFNLFALARLYRVKADSLFWNTVKFKKSINYVHQDEFFVGLENPNVKLDASLKNHITDQEERSVNIYGYPYNVPGFEVAYVAEVFKGMISTDIVDRCLEKQLNYTFDVGKSFFGIKCHDKQTINYRVYEYYRLLEIEH